jgi:hypothetical protein
MMTDFTQKVFTVMCAFFIAGMILYMYNVVVNMPHVVYDRNWNCVEVFSPKPDHDCNNVGTFKHTHEQIVGE